MSQTINDFGRGLKQLGGETAENLVTEGAKIIEPIITAQELLGGIKPMSEGEMSARRAEDEKGKREEMARLKGGYSEEQGRKVENELEKVRSEREKYEEDLLKHEEEYKRQKERERQEQDEYYANISMMESGNPSKQKKSRGSAMVRKKKSQPDQSQMSQTSEFKGGKID